MKKIVRLYWQVGLFLVFYVPYCILNTKVLVKKFGCACPVMVDGVLKQRAFNANDITNVFWSGVALVVLIISAFSMKRIKGVPRKIGYLLSMVAICLLFSIAFIYQMMWC